MTEKIGLNTTFNAELDFTGTPDFVLVYDYDVVSVQLSKKFEELNNQIKSSQL